MINVWRTIRERSVIYRKDDHNNTTSNRVVMRIVNVNVLIAVTLGCMYQDTMRSKR
jgi:hypothetical protein